MNGDSGTYWDRLRDREAGTQKIPRRVLEPGTVFLALFSFQRSDKRRPCRSDDSAISAIARPLAATQNGRGDPLYSYYEQLRAKSLSPNTVPFKGYKWRT